MRLCNLAMVREGLSDECTQALVLSPGALWSPRQGSLQAWTPDTSLITLWGPQFYLRIQSSGLVVWLPLSCNWYQRHLHSIISFTPMTQPPTRVLVSACPSAQHPHQQVLSTQLRGVYRNSGIPGSHSPPEEAQESLLSSKHNTLHCTLLLQLPLW